MAALEALVNVGGPGTLLDVNGKGPTKAGKPVAYWELGLPPLLYMRSKTISLKLEGDRSWYQVPVKR